MGPGAKSSLAPRDVSRFFYTPSKLGGGPDYFRVCSVNDAGRQCSGSILSRQPTRAELMAVSQRSHVSFGMVSGGTPPAAGGPRTAPAAVPGPVMGRPMVPCRGKSPLRRGRREGV